MMSLVLPKLLVNVPEFVREVEGRLKADEEELTCCVCFELFANVKLECSHKLCPTCHDKLDTCPLCRVRFKEETCVFANFDACVWRSACQPSRCDVYLYSGKMPDELLLFQVLFDAFKLKGLDLRLLLDPGVVFSDLTDARATVEAIRCHTEMLDKSGPCPLRRMLVETGIFDGTDKCLI